MFNRPNISATRIPRPEPLSEDLVLELFTVEDIHEDSFQKVAHVLRALGKLPASSATGNPEVLSSFLETLPDYLRPYRDVVDAGVSSPLAKIVEGINSPSSQLRTALIQGTKVLGEEPVFLASTGKEKMRHAQMFPEVFTDTMFHYMERGSIPQSGTRFFLLTPELIQDWELMFDFVSLSLKYNCKIVALCARGLPACPSAELFLRRIQPVKNFGF